MSMAAARTIEVSRDVDPDIAAPQVSRWRRRRADYSKPGFVRLAALFTYVFLYAPVICVVLFSFNKLQSFADFEGFTLQWYRAFFESDPLRSAVWNSLYIAFFTTIISTLLGTTLAIGLNRAKTRLASGGNILLVLPIITPELALATSLLLMYGEIGIDFSRTTVIAAHAAFITSFVTIIVRGRINNLNPEIEEAAMDLGASRLGSVWLVTIPSLWPAIVAGALFGFALSFDNFLLSFFTSGVGDQTLPVVVYASVRNQIRPTVNAVGTLMLLLTLVLLALGWLVLHFGTKRQRQTAPS